MRLSLFLVCLIGWPAFAALPITGATGVSNIDLTTTPVTIYGGMAGECTATSNTSTCDSCTLDAMALDVACAFAAEGLCACNKARIHDGLIFRINVTKPSTVTGNAKLIVGANSTIVTPNIEDNNGNYFQATWGNLCSAFGSASCAAVTTVINGRLFIDADNDNSLDSGEEYTDVNFRILKPDSAEWSVYGSGTNTVGYSSFTPFPGDEKVYITDPVASSDIPNLTGYGGVATHLRVFYSKEGMEQANALAQFKDLPISKDGNHIENNSVRGLENGVTYVFRIAMVDNAGNIVQFYPDNALDPACQTTQAPDFNGCTFSATPEEVLGLLQDDFNCFVATAAYGSWLEPKIQVFRKFRNTILLPRAWGRSLIFQYYKYGPYLSRWIHDKPMAKTIVRAALYPAYLMSHFALRFGIVPAILLSLTVLTTSVFLLGFGWRRAFGRA